ncbi:RagB/SusD family nutrient uptake outer membrane protein [Draconibacterium sp. IB214405]|uniref:RagB/SusD family nutrient uptake outer membrane protein n=1 Tax=Draconibacterium sp. IB214405 TaxID=3097352 RepID=UPI002A10ED53|nr:RagB/SusD family nutrient uptake outer membrane protein [Draconibacterium sp. IB214405]MDX8340683.1 RagB/SusD family nutrient uptake outer membrane protein [Draconibacterium sp. IB214405]
MIKKLFVCLVIVSGVVGCNLNYQPYDGIPESELKEDIIGLNGATVGNYNYLKDSYYQRNFHFFGEYGGDNVSLSGTTSDHLFYCYNYQHFPAMNTTSNFWEKAYQLIVGCNKVILSIDDSASDELRQLKGENLFLRAQTLFHLTNTFGRPYYQSPETNLGVPIKLDDNVVNVPARGTVKEVYEQIIADLLQAEALMGSERENVYGSKEVAQAMLSRVYLYMSGTPENPDINYAQKAKDYANKVIDSGRYHLEETEEFKTYFRKLPEQNTETIFAVKHTIDVDDRGWGSIGSMYNHIESQGWGEMYASEPYRELLDENPEDARHAFIEPQYESDGITLKERNGYPIYYINKFSMQEERPTLSSPVYLRLAEMYLNRAEANAKLGLNEEAIEDVNLIRSRAGLSGDALYSTDDLKGRASVFDVVLEERRLELAFEAQRKWDIFRNGLTLDRNYPGTHEQGDALLFVPPDHRRVVFYIPEAQILVQENLVQNP